MLTGERKWQVWRNRLLTGLAIVAVAMAAGCAKSDKIGVAGRVTRKDGTPLVGAKVTFRAPSTGRTATGITDSDGRYVLGTSKPGEGIPADRYYVTVSENRGTENAPLPATVNDKYTRPDESKLNFVVGPDGDTSFDIVLDPI